MTAGQIAIVVVMSGFGAMVQGSTGLGMTLVAGPVLFAIDPTFAPGPLMMVGLIVSTRHLIVERAHIDRPGLVRFAVGAPVGLAVGLAVLSTIGERQLALVIGSLIVVAVAVVLSGFHPARSNATLAAGGAVTALTSVTASLPGPPFAISFHDSPPPVLRGTIGSFLVPFSSISLVLMTLLGEFGRHELALAGVLVPGVVIGLVASRWARPYLDRTWFRQAVLALSAVGGVALILRNL